MLLCTSWEIPFPTCILPLESTYVVISHTPWGYNHVQMHLYCIWKTFPSIFPKAQLYSSFPWNSPKEAFIEPYVDLIFLLVPSLTLYGLNTNSNSCLCAHLLIFYFPHYTRCSVMLVPGLAVFISTSLATNIVHKHIVGFQQTSVK